MIALSRPRTDRVIVIEIPVRMRQPRTATETQESQSDSSVRQRPLERYTSVKLGAADLAVGDQLFLRSIWELNEAGALIYHSIITGLRAIKWRRECPPKDGPQTLVTVRDYSAAPNTPTSAPTSTPFAHPRSPLGNGCRALTVQLNSSWIWSGPHPSSAASSNSACFRIGSSISQCRHAETIAEIANR